MSGGYIIYYVVSFLFHIISDMIENNFPFQSNFEFSNNFKRNWWFPISGMALFCLNASPTFNYCYGIIISSILSVFISSRIISIKKIIEKPNLIICILSILTSMGICLAGFVSFYENYHSSALIQYIGSVLSLPIDFAFFAGVFGAICAFWFSYVCLLIFYKKLTEMFYKTRVFDSLNTIEKTCYLIIILVTVAFVSNSFLKSEAFYGTEVLFDIIYTSDSPSLIKENVYLFLTQDQNDLKQPLFAVFSAPFMGIPYLFSVFFPPAIKAILLDIVQIVLMVFANYLLSRIMNLSALKRICFMIISSFSYTYLLFSLMMEQYIITYFWLVLFLYYVLKNEKTNRFAIWGAGGTLITSMVLLPLLAKHNPFKKFKKWVNDLIYLRSEFLVVLFFFCRFDILCDMSYNMVRMSRFAGKNIQLIDKVLQYFAFIRSCLIAPNAGIDFYTEEHISWQLREVTSMDWIGFTIFVLVLVSSIVNRKQKSSNLFTGWVIFSIFMLVFIGWGTAENGLILYALYFGWAYLLLLFHLLCI